MSERVPDKPSLETVLPETRTLIRTRSVSFEYGAESGETPIHAVNSVDLEVQAGEFVVILGPNGSGKSTLMSLCSGLLRPSSGDVWLGEDSAYGLPSRERARRVAVVPQGLPRVPSMRVEDFVLGGRYPHFGFWRTARRADTEAVDAALSRVAADECRGRLLADMSGGQRQRVLVARALAQESALILLDEPTASLDPEHQLLVFDLASELAAHGRGIVVVTHDFNLASQYADRVLLLDGGQAVAAGAPGEVLVPDALLPIYGRRLHFGQLPSAVGPALPTVLAWRHST